MAKQEEQQQSKIQNTDEWRFLHISQFYDPNAKEYGVQIPMNAGGMTTSSKSILFLSKQQARDLAQRLLDAAK